MLELKGRKGVQNIQSAIYRTSRKWNHYTQMMFPIVWSSQREIIKCSSFSLLCLSDEWCLSWVVSEGKDQMSAGSNMSSWSWLIREGTWISSSFSNCFWTLFFLFCFLLSHSNAISAWLSKSWIFSALTAIPPAISRGSSWTVTNLALFPYLWPSHSVFRLPTWCESCNTGETH